MTARVSAAAESGDGGALGRAWRSAGGRVVPWGRGGWEAARSRAGCGPLAPGASGRRTVPWARRAAAAGRDGAVGPVRGGAVGPGRGGAVGPVRGGAVGPVRGGAVGPVRGGAVRPARARGAAPSRVPALAWPSSRQSHATSA